MADDTSLTAPRYEVAEEEQAALTDFFQRPYFQRVWIVQEVAASRDAVVLRGHKAISLTTFADVLRGLPVGYVSPALLVLASAVLDIWTERADTYLDCCNFLQSIAREVPRIHVIRSLLCSELPIR